MKIPICLKQSEPNSPNMNKANYNKCVKENLIYEVVSRYNLIKKHIHMYKKMLFEREGNCQSPCNMLIILINHIFFILLQ